LQNSTIFNEQFDQPMIQVTHTNHQFASELYRRANEKFESCLTPGRCHLPQPAAGGFVAEGGVKFVGPFSQWSAEDGAVTGGFCLD
jgi:hypothetical protein